MCVELGQQVRRTTTNDMFLLLSFSRRNHISQYDFFLISFLVCPLIFSAVPFLFYMPEINWFWLPDWRPRRGLAVLCFYSKTVFGPYTAKSQPMWIKFCVHLLLYGIHLWVDLDHDQRVGGSRANQNVYVFVLLVTYPRSYMRRRIAAISAANRQSGGEDGCYREKSRNFIVWAEPDPKKTTFFAF